MKKLLYTTNADLSLEYFADWDVVYYSSALGDIHEADLVYFRDPFNDQLYHPDPGHIAQLVKQHQNARIIDRLTGFDDIVKSEDKYLQSQLYQDLYPTTWLPSQQAFVPGKHLAKPRISQRAKDILFELGDRQLDDNWIIQELLDIKEELRVYTVYGQVIQLASIKSPKASGKVKVIGTRELTDEEQAFVHQALQHCSLDFVGFDLAILRDGRMKIIEVNRSPQFRAYMKLTGINLATKIAKKPH